MGNKRNQLCPCGSGERYKKCCGRTGENPAASEVRAQERVDGALAAANCLRLGEAAAGQGRLEEAARYYRQAIALQPDYPAALNNLGVICRAQGNLVEAAACFNRLIEIDPGSPTGYCNRGVVLQAQGCYGEAAASFRSALAAKPDFAEAHFNLGVILEHQSLLDAAEACYQQAVAHDPGFVNALNRLGNLRKADGRLEEAAACYLQALAARPKSDLTLYNLAVLRKEQGRLDEARENCRQALAVRPDFGEAHRCLASLVKYEAKTDQHMLAMENLLKRNELQGPQRLHLSFALGKAYEDLGEYEESFACYQEGNRLKRATFSYEKADAVAFFGQIRQVFSKIPYSPSLSEHDEKPRPVFILGMPRSGTSLVEQILASHPEVYGAGELDDLRQIILQVTGTEQQQEAFTRLGEDQGRIFARIGEEYLRRLREKLPAFHLVTDKMPENFLFIGVIRLALPAARIVHCQRDPMDTCFSIYKNLFAGEIGYAYDLTELGEYCRSYLDLMRFWHRLYPGIIYDLSYEKLIANQERETRRLLDYCGLPWHRGCLDFHRTERRVVTASSVQVRRALYPDSVALWRRYAQQLAPLKAALGEPDL